MKEALLSLSYHVYDHESELDAEEQKLISAARKATDTSYSPYSHFMVGAALLLEDHSIILGSNQENASYPAGLCAERVALFGYGAAYPHLIIKKMAVVATKKSGTAFIPVTPCGSCRQVMLEYENRQEAPIEVIMQSSDYKWIKMKSTKTLLPFCFNLDSL